MRSIPATSGQLPMTGRFSPTVDRSAIRPRRRRQADPPVRPRSHRRQLTPRPLPPHQRKRPRRPKRRRRRRHRPPRQHPRKPPPPRQHPRRHQKRTSTGCRGSTAMARSRGVERGRWQSGVRQTPVSPPPRSTRGCRAFRGTRAAIRSLGRSTLSQADHRAGTDAGRPAADGWAAGSESA